jgi:hypothetical protein
MIFKKYEFLHKGKFYYLFFEDAGYDSEAVDVWMGDKDTHKEAVVYTTLYGEHPLAKNIDCYYLGGWYYRILIDKGYFEAFVCLILEDTSLLERLIDNFNKQIKEQKNPIKTKKEEIEELCNYHKEQFERPKLSKGIWGFKKGEFNDE